MKHDNKTTQKAGDRNAEHEFWIEEDYSGTYIKYILEMNGVEIGTYNRAYEAERVRDNIKKAIGGDRDE